MDTRTTFLAAAVGAMVGSALTAGGFALLRTAENPTKPARISPPPAIVSARPATTKVTSPSEPDIDELEYLGQEAPNERPWLIPAPAAGEIKPRPSVEEEIAQEIAALGAKRYRVEPVPVGGIIKARTSEQDRLFQEAASLVAQRRPVPDERLRYFEKILGYQGERKPPRIVRSLRRSSPWHCFVADVTPRAGGRKITLWSSYQGSRLINRYVEEYEWIGDELRFSTGHPFPGDGDAPKYFGM